MLGKYGITACICGGILALGVGACGSDPVGCEGPKLNEQALLNAKSTLFSSGPSAFIVSPNPIEATGNALATFSSRETLSAGGLFSLPDLSNPNRLENAFLKIRIKEMNDDVSTLAAPNSEGNFVFDPKSVHYGEAMAYHSVSALKRYIEALGFSIVQSRPLYVMVLAGSGGDVNAFYDHSYLSPKSPRMMKLYGDTQHPLRMDRDIYWHEFGHMLNESVSGERGMDFAGDNGAIFTEGAALHECLADYLAESVSDKDFIGKWTARNFDYPEGQALRYATDVPQDTLNFKDVIRADGTGSNPERYLVAEWCSRVLWDIRAKFVNEDPVLGPSRADRLIFSAVSLLGQDSSLSQFKSALHQADEILHCSGTKSRIDYAFETRGFKTTPNGTTAKMRELQFEVTPLPYNLETGESKKKLEPGDAVLFETRIYNPNDYPARNVRIRIEIVSPGFSPLVYMQGFGDVPGGRTLKVGTTGMSFDFSVVGVLDKKLTAGTRVPFQMRLLVENAPESIIQGELQL